MVARNTPVTKCLMQNSRAKKGLEKTHVRREDVREYDWKVRHSNQEQYVSDSLIIEWESAHIMTRMSCTPLRIWSKQVTTSGPYSMPVHSFHWHVQNATIPCRSQELLPFFYVIYFFLPPFSTNYSFILPQFILASISWPTSQSYCFQIHT